MDNNELDKILKEKLNGKIEPSAEFKEKINKKIEEQKQAKTIEKKEQNVNKKEKRPKKHKKVVRILSMVAVLLIVFTIGINFKELPIGENNGQETVIIKTIEPTKLESGILANNSEFLITAEGKKLSAEAIQKSIYIEPALEYTVEKTSNANEYKLKFKQNIPDNTILKLQYVKNQITENSWAYQTSSKLSVTKTYPENNAVDVSEKTVIDIDFSYPNIENLTQNVEISPKIQGEWNHIGSIWRFTPSLALEHTKYTVKINKGITANEEILEDDYIFNFTVGETDYSKVNYSGITADGIVTTKPNEPVKISFCNYSNSKAEFGKVEIAKFENIDDFIEYVENNNYEKAEKQGNYDVQSYEEDNYGYIELKNTLPKGYYIAKVKNAKGKELFNCPIQVCEYSSYAMETERDVLVWVAKENDLLSNVKIEYQGKTVTTDNQGLAYFKDIADGSKKIKYAKVGNELVIGIYNYELNEYPSSYIYTDRPLYKNTDTINIWGFVPRTLFYDKIDEEFYIELGEEGKQKVNVDENGNFKYAIELKNHINQEATNIVLYYKDTQIAYRYISIQNYELQNYTYEVITDKKYIEAGETLKFDVKVNHITGLLVPNKNVTIKMGENYIETKTTGEDGIAHFEVKLENASEIEETNPEYRTIEIFNGDENEYTMSETEFTTLVLKRNVYTQIDYNEKDNYKAVLYKLSEDKNTDISWDLHELYGGTYETEVDIVLREEVDHRYISGYRYNEYTKENEPEYDYEGTTENKTKLKTVNSTNGIVQINKDEIKTKEDTDTERYSYFIEFSYKDLNGRKVVDYTYYSKFDYYQIENEIGYSYSNDYEGEMGDSTDKLYEIQSLLNSVYDNNYNVYRYFLKSEYSSYGIGDKIDLILSESTTSGFKEIENTGKLLTIVFKEGITETNVITESSFSHEFTEKDFPGCKITASYFVNGKFYRMPAVYYDFDEETRKVDIEISPDKNEYKPGDTVTLNIKTTNNGTPIKTNVNISVVNKAVFEVQEDTTDLIENIYTSKNYAAYTYSSYRDELKASGGGGAGGGDGAPRANFADTVCFETVSTNQNGIAQVTFKLPDNVTTYRVTAHATNSDLYLGVATKDITSKLDFFIQSTEPRGIKSTDDTVLNATSIADTKYDVNYEFYIKELGKTLTTTSTTNSIATVNFGKLPLGVYHVVIKGTHENQQDMIEYQFNVVETTQEVSKKTTINVNETATIKPSKNPITLEIYNKNMSKYIEYIDFIESTVSERLDTQIAYNKVQEIKDKYYGDTNSTRQIEMSLYQGERGYLKDLRSGNEDIVLTALIRYYAKGYYQNVSQYMGINELSADDNVFEYYLLKSAEMEPVLNDLQYLKQEPDISNYNKLLVTLSLEFVGDFQSAKELYSTILLSSEEQDRYASIAAIIETFIDKQNVTNKIDKLIQNSPADEYLRFACISYLQNNSNEIGKTETVSVIGKNAEKTFILNGMQIEKYTIYDEDLEELKFQTESKDLMVSYYYQTSIENVENENILQDIKIVGKGELKKGNTIKLTITFDGDYEGEVKIALPNSLRLTKNYNAYNVESKYYMQENNINYVTLYKMKECKKIELPLLITNEGSYYFEPIICYTDGIYHISNSTTLNIE